MRLDTTLSWLIKCPKCGDEAVYGTDSIFTVDERLELAFSCDCKACSHHFGYVQTYVNDSDTDRYADEVDMSDYKL